MTVHLDFLALGPAAVLRVNGVLDQGGADCVYQQVEEIVAAGFANLVINLSGVERMTPDGVMMIEAIRHHMALCKGNLYLTSPPAGSSEVLQIYGLSSDVDFFSSEWEALSQVDFPLGPRRVVS